MRKSTIRTNDSKHILRMVIDHGDKTLRKNYIQRHLRDLDSNDYTRAGYLSLFLLWDKPTLKESIIAFKKRIKNDDWRIKI